MNQHKITLYKSLKVVGGVIIIITIASLALHFTDTVSSTVTTVTGLVTSLASAIYSAVVVSGRIL